MSWNAWTRLQVVLLPCILGVLLFSQIDRPAARPATAVLMAILVLAGLCLATNAWGVADKQAEQARDGVWVVPPVPVLASTKASRLLGWWLVVVGLIGVLTVVLRS